MTFYGAYKTGYLAGGASNPGTVGNYAAQKPSDPESLLEYNAQTTHGFEFGAKGYLLDGRLRAEAVVYRYDIKGLQVQALDQNTLSFFIRNAGSARSEGFDLSANFQATQQLNLHGSVVYTRLEYLVFTNAQCYAGQPAPQCVRNVQDLSGTRYGGPPTSINFGGIFDQPIGGDFKVSLLGDLYYYSKTPPLLRDPIAVQKGVTIFNASIRLTQEGQPWEVALIGTNLTNEIRFATFADKPYGIPGDKTGTFANPPRQVQVELKYRF
jgi:outer membrane receptor protein involved in Fe transport